MDIVDWQSVLLGDARHGIRGKTKASAQGLVRHAFRVQQLEGRSNVGAHCGQRPEYGARSEDLPSHRREEPVSIPCSRIWDLYQLPCLAMLPAGCLVERSSSRDRDRAGARDPVCRLPNMSRTRLAGWPFDVCDDEMSPAVSDCSWPAAQAAARLPSRRRNARANGCWQHLLLTGGGCGGVQRCRRESQRSTLRPVSTSVSVFLARARTPAPAVFRRCSE